MTDWLEKNDNSLEAPIGVFDSGMGGISVLKALVHELPAENFIYFGDSANAPYGIKSQGQICALSLCAVEYLIKKHVKALVVACNTASGAAAGILQSAHPEIPVISIEPALKQAVKAFPKGNIILMATPYTIKSKKFAGLFRMSSKKANVSLIPVFGLVELIEAGTTEGPVVRKILMDHLEQYMNRKIDAVVLGCTHFYYVKDEIQNALGHVVSFFDSGHDTAQHLQQELKIRGLLRKEYEKNVFMGGAVTFLNSLHSENTLKQMWDYYQR